MSGNNNNSIHVLDVQSGEIRQLVEADRSGYGFSWSADSEHILFRHTLLDDRSAKHAPAIVDLAGGEMHIVGEYSVRMPALPVWSPDASKVFTTNGKDVVSKPSDVVLEASKLASPQLVDYLKDQSVVMNRGASLALITPTDIQSLNPMPGSEYINAALSPDGTQIVFEVLGGGMHVLNLATGAIIDLGSGNRPVWSPAGNRIAFMVAEDDGYTFTSSDIYVINADGSGRRLLSTTTSLMEMNPSWSPDGTRIAFDVYATGDVYIITIDPS